MLGQSFLDREAPEVVQVPPSQGGRLAWAAGPSVPPGRLHPRWVWRTPRRAPI